MDFKNIQYYIKQSALNNIDSLIYNKKIGKADLNIIIENIKLEKKAHLKLPTFKENNCIFTQKSFEQSTAESIAILKSNLFSGSNILILAGGLGVDDWAFSKTFETVISTDKDAELNEIAMYNFENLNCVNIERITQNAEDFILQNSEKKFNYIYIDPDRRGTGKKEILLSEHLPNVIKMFPELSKISDNILIKCSPLYDIKMAHIELPPLTNCYSLSYKGEMKELLLHINLKNENDCEYHCIDIDDQKTISYSIKKDTLSTRMEKLQDLKLPYFYDLGASIVKMRLNNDYASELNLKSIDIKVPFYMSESNIDRFIGKKFKVISIFDKSDKSFEKYLKQANIKEINIKVRGLNYNSTDLLKKWRLKEGGLSIIYVFPFKNEVKIALLDRIK